MSFESSLIWYSERGQTTIFITHSKCHFHAAIFFNLTLSYLACYKKKARIKPRSTWKDVARVFEAAHDDIFKNNWEVCLISKESWGVPGYTGMCPTSSCDHKGWTSAWRLSQDNFSFSSHSLPWLGRCLFFCTSWRCCLSTGQGMQQVDFQFACGATGLQ